MQPRDSLLVLVEAHELQPGDKIVSPAGRELTVTHKVTVVSMGEVTIFAQTLTNTQAGWTSGEYCFNPKDAVAIRATKDDLGVENYVAV